jgi:hypothetical protein
MSASLMKEIQTMFGSLDRISSFVISEDGLLINDIAFRPQFDEDFIESLPFDMKDQVQAGNIVELFHFSNVWKFKNLVALDIDNSLLAEGRVRREMGISENKSWAFLFTRFRYLRQLIIGGTPITNEVQAEEYDKNGRGGYNLTESLREKLGVPLKFVTSSPMQHVWHSKPVKTFGGAAGWTLGVKLALMSTAVFGPFGLLFAGLAGFGALRSAKNSGAFKGASTSKVTKNVKDAFSSKRK